jgi:hypothetical protein
MLLAPIKATITGGQPQGHQEPEGEAVQRVRSIVAANPARRAAFIHHMCSLSRGHNEHLV